MTHPIQTSRRNALKMLGGAPLLPLAASAAGGASFLFRAGPAFATPAVTSASFVSMAAPTLDNAAAMATTSVGSSLSVTFSDGTQQNYALSYEPFFVTGAEVPDGKGGTLIAGGYYDINGKPILDDSSSEAQKPQFFSDCPDGFSLLKPENASVEGVQGNALFAVVQFEYTSLNAAGGKMYGLLPSPIAVLTLDQDKSSGRLKLVKYSPVDNTHLSSEEYEPDATVAENKQLAGFSQNLFGDPAKANPYHYGHLPEVTVNPDGTGSVTKHYCLGRISHELVQVMPDERTVLMGDDATNGGLFMFVADKARDLSSGTLYVAKWNQKTKENGGSADLGWIKLGHATSDQVKALADSLKAADILDVKTEDPKDPSYVQIPYSGKPNWVKFSPGQELAAAFLETHRYAAVKGGSLGFTKMEGTSVNAKDKVAYSVISYIKKEMKNGSGGISVDGPNAGAIYALNMKGGQADDTGAAIDSEWVPVDMAAVPALVGQDLDTPDEMGNLAAIDKLGNPDNIKFSERLRTLFIGEDSGTHVNNYLWAFNVDTRQLSRLLSTPSGAESTGLHAVDDANGFTYIMSNFQHAGDWELEKDASGNVTGGLHVKVYEKLTPLIKANYADARGKLGGAVGYLSGMPAAS